MHAATLPRRLQHPRCRCFEALVGVGDHQLHPAQAAPHQAAQKLRPERLRLRGPGRHAEHLTPTLGVHRHSDYRGHRYDPAALAHFDVGGVDPQVRPVTFERPVQERVDALIDLFAQPRYLALGDPGHAHCLDQVVDRARGDALDVRLLDHRRQRLLRRPPRLQESREVAPAPQLRYPQRNRAAARVPVPIAEAVAPVLAALGAFAVAGANQPIHVHVHQPLRHKANHLAQQIAVGPLLKQLRQCHPFSGHRFPLRFS